jgi:hypothetical protein
MEITHEMILREKKEKLQEIENRNKKRKKKMNKAGLISAPFIIAGAVALFFKFR